MMRFPFSKFVLLFTLMLSATFSGAQIPDKFENLQVLPKDISKRELTQIMRGFATALGTRCWGCHVGEKNAPLSSYDFVSDKKHEKEDARLMLKMVQNINDQFIKELDNKRKQAERVTCRTCHRGLSHPLTLESVLSATLARKGVDAAVKRYHSLREKYYGRDSYDFGEVTLLQLAETLGMEEKVDEAIKFLEINLEFFPESGFTYHNLAEAHARKGNKAEAIKYFEKTLALMPENRRARQRLAELKK